MSGSGEIECEKFRSDPEFLFSTSNPLLLGRQDCCQINPGKFRQKMLDPEIMDLAKPQSADT
jgi:hypothetical protein